jgi:diguanylate cyclase (GGDEF)-like protein
MPLNRSTGATIARTGGRLVAALLPLAAFAVVRALPSATQGSPLPWVAPGIAATTAVVAGLALLAAVAVSMADGRIRNLADAAGLGMLGTAFAVVALEGTGNLGLGIGAGGAAAAVAAGSLSGGRSLSTRRNRVIGIVVATVLVEAVLAAVLLSAPLAVDDRFGPFLLAGGSLLLALAALAGFRDAARATALGMAASSALAMALAGPSGNERLVGVAGMALAALVIGWRLLASRSQRSAVAEPDPAIPELPAASESPPEYDELARLTRELRATLDDLVAARHLIELQRVEIDRATSTDALTGLPSRWPTLDRLRTEAAEARRYAHPVAAVLLDIDNFADLNHEHGLDVGDQMLRRLALRLRVRMREADAVGRVGADAFLAILPHTDERGAATFAQAVLDRVLERRVMTERGEVTVSLSIGIALMRPGMSLTGDELLAAAEEALASARAAGGNRIAFDRLHGLARVDEPDRGTEIPTADFAAFAEGNA